MRRFAYRKRPDWWDSDWHITGTHGQSRSANAAEGTDVCYAPTEVALSPGQHIMMNNDRAPGHDPEEDWYEYQASDITDFVDGRGTLANPKQRPLGQSLGTLMERLKDADVANGRSAKRRLYYAGGEFGKKISTLTKQADPFDFGDGVAVQLYERNLRMLNRSAQLARAYGRNPIVETMLFLQGEADGDKRKGTQTALSTYKTQLAQLIADFRADIPVITGQTSPFEFIMDFVASVPMSPNLNGCGVGVPATLAQIELAIENSDGHTWSIGPNYWLPFFGAEHMAVESVVRLAEMFGLARALLFDGGQPTFLYAKTFSVVDNLIIIECNVPVGSLTFDTTELPDATGTSLDNIQFVKGFEVTSDEGITITDVSLNDNFITITLSARPTQAPFSVGYAYNGFGNVDYVDVVTGRSLQTPGAWGNVRDERATNSLMVPGAKLRNYLSQFYHTFYTF